MCSFDTIPHIPLLEMLRQKISDHRFVKLVANLMEMPIEKGGKTEISKQGCPQGSIISPVLANIYLHHVIDEWFASISETHLRGKARMVRYADDMVFVFEDYGEAEKFYKALPKRLAKYGLELKEEKSQLTRAGVWAARKAAETGD